MLSADLRLICDKLQNQGNEIPQYFYSKKDINITSFLPDTELINR
jgi:hypothetical protein